MEPQELDEVDRGILHLLQEDARNNSASAMADALGVAPNTVRNRLDRLEANGVVLGYHPHIDYERAGFQLRVIFICSTSITERSNSADQVLDVEGVVRIVELLSGKRNLAIEAVSNSTDDLTEIGRRIEDIGLVIDEEWFVKRDSVQPFDHFGAEAVDR